MKTIVTIIFLMSSLCLHAQETEDVVEKDSAKVKKRLVSSIGFDWGNYMLIRHSTPHLYSNEANATGQKQFRLHFVTWNRRNWGLGVQVMRGSVIEDWRKAFPSPIRPDLDLSF